MAVSNTHECVCLRVCACVDSNPGLVIAIVFIVALCLLAVVAASLGTSLLSVLLHVYLYTNLSVFLCVSVRLSSCISA